MKVRVKPLMMIKKVMGNKSEIEVDLEKDSLRGLMEKLSQSYGEEFSNLTLDPKTREIKPFYLIFINGRHYQDIPEKMDAKLIEGDLVTISPPVGGG